MFDLRGYAYTEEASFLDAGRKQIESARTTLKETIALTAGAQSLGGLKEAAEKATADIDEYEALANETVKRNDAMAKARIVLNDAALRAMTAAEQYMAIQHKTVAAALGSAQPANAGSAAETALKRMGLMHELVVLAD